MSAVVHLQSHERKRVVLVGDSITQQSLSMTHGGWGAGLADWYQRTADIKNRGYSGYNSRWIRQSLDTIFPTSDPSNKDVVLVTLFLGANDAAALPSMQHISLPEYSDNMAHILDQLRTVFPNAKIILITPPQVNNVLWPDRSIPQVAEYAEIIRKLAKNAGVPVLDLWREDAYKVELDDLNDGLHLGTNGNRKVCEGLQDIIRKNYPHLRPEDDASGHPNMRYHLPQHREVGDLNDLQKSKILLKDWKW